MSDKKAPSFCELECKQCHKKLQKRNLEAHYQTFHSEKDYKESLVAPGNLHAFLKRPTPLDTESNPKQSKTDEPPKEPPGNSNRTDTPTGDAPRTNVPVCSSSTSGHVEPSKGGELALLLKNQNEMLGMLRSIQNQNTLEKPIEQTNNESKKPLGPFPNDLEYILTKADDPDFLLKNIDWLVLSDSDLNKAICLACSDQSLLAKGTPGVFACDQEFKRLKYTIKEHAKLESHLLKLKECNLSNEKSMKALKRNEEVGMRLGGICYQIIHEGESLRSYPKKVALLASNNVDCGTANHS